MKMIKNIGRRKSETAKFYQSWGLFQCPHCGNIVERHMGSGKKNKSCGCMRVAHATKHGLSTNNGKKNPLFIVWALIKRRCVSPKDNHYKYYGGRGISICEEWANDFAIFSNWALKNGWKKGLQIDRKDNDGNYEPGNCRFVNSQVNVQNSRIAKLTIDQVIEIRRDYPKSGKTYKAFAKQYGVTGEAISNIIRNKAWDNITFRTKRNA